MPETLRGVMWYGHRHPDFNLARDQDWIRNNGVLVLRVYIRPNEWGEFTCAPEEVEPLLSPNGPVQMVIMKVGEKREHLDDHRKIIRAFEGGHGPRFLKSWSDLVDEYADTVTFYLQFGNEPDQYFDRGKPGHPGPSDEGWVYRHLALETYKRLANNACGDVPRAWRERYPKLKWSIAIPAVSRGYMDNLLQHIPWEANDPGCNDDLDAGSVLDYYDVVSPHLYCEREFPDPGSPGDSWEMFKVLQSMPAVKGIILTEIGVNGGTWEQKIEAVNALYKQHLDHSKVIAACWYHLGRIPHPNYEVQTEWQLKGVAGDPYMARIYKETYVGDGSGEDRLISVPFDPLMVYAVAEGKSEEGGSGLGIQGTNRGIGKQLTVGQGMHRAGGTVRVPEIVPGGFRVRHASGQNSLNEAGKTYHFVAIG